MDHAKIAALACFYGYLDISFLRHPDLRSIFLILTLRACFLFQQTIGVTLNHTMFIEIFG